MIRRELPRQPRFRHRGWRGALSVGAGLLLLIVVLIVSSRWGSADWPDAAGRAVQSPYAWLAVLAYLVRYLVGPERPRSSGTWRNGLTVGYWVLLALVVFTAVFAGSIFPDRWYGDAVKALLAVLGATFVADSAHRLLAPSSDSGPAVSHDRPR
ncbi:hypothetical protein E0H26_04900 [Micromonospora zingiberis]|uniref:Uncharacterized protein n=1 Tax=Micromonospora zingiberis TaxID=2053011 RepID=A0A4R0GVA0_9ACTN|nr:hypothetical protein [Micromonospora zingiberis]TCB99879.1 hypothetical protein E0H26_04900 [Micromonospora zingiberis]